MLEHSWTVEHYFIKKSKSLSTSLTFQFSFCDESKSYKNYSNLQINFMIHANKLISVYMYD